MSAKVVDKLEKKSQILEAAIREFIKKGFARTTINDIAKAAGIGKGTIYEYFSNKEEIIDSSFQHFVHALEVDFAQILSAPVTPPEKLTTFFQSYSDFLDAHTSETLEIMFDFWSESIKSKGQTKSFILQEMKGFYDAYREIFAQILIEGMKDGSFRHDINPQSAASMMVGALDGILVQWVLDRQNFDFKDVVKTMSQTFLKGVSK